MQNAVPWNNLTMNMIDIGNTHQTWFWICFGIIAKYPDTVLECVWMYYIWTGTWYIMQCTKKCTHHNLWYNDGNRIPRSIRHKFQQCLPAVALTCSYLVFWMMNTPSTKGNGRPVHFEVRDASALDLFSVSSPMSGWWRRTSSGTIQQVGSFLCASRETADVQVLLKEFGASNLPPSDFFSSREGNNPTFAGRSLMAGGSFTWSFHHTHPASAALDKKQEEARVVTGGAGRGLMINSEPETLWCGVTIYWDFIWPSMEQSEQLSFLYGWYAELLVVNIRIFHCHRKWKEPELLGFPHLIEKSPRHSGRLRVHNNWEKLDCFGTYAAIYELCAPVFLALPLLHMYDCCLVSQRLFFRVYIYIL